MTISSVKETLKRAVAERRESRKGAFVLIALLCWTYVNLLLAFHYEPWRDVAQAWMIARQLNLSELFAQLKREGHPCLWYLALMPFAKTGMPFYTIIILSFSLMFFGIWRFLTHAPLNRVSKLIVVFSALGMYYLPVEARSYSMLPLLLMLLYAAYPNRYARPVWYAALLFLLCQVHVLLCGVVGALMLQWVIEAVPAWKQEPAKRTRLAVSAAIMAGAVAALYLQLAGSSSIPPIDIAAKFPDLQSLFRKPVDFFSGAVAVQSIAYMNAERVAQWIPMAAVLFLAAVLAVWILWLLRAPRSATAALAAVAWHAAVHLFVYPVTSMRFIVTLLWILLFCVFLAKDELKRRPAGKHARLDRSIPRILVVSTVLLCLATCLQVYSDMLTEYTTKNSMAKEAADYIEARLPEDSVVLIENEIYAAPVAAWARDGRFCNPIRHNGHILSMIDGNMGGWCSTGDLDATIAQLRQDGIAGPLYLLVNLADEPAALDMGGRSAAGLAEIARMTDDLVLKGEEQYILYQIVESP